MWSRQPVDRQRVRRADLRDTGLLVTRRAGRSVHHELTGLGTALLDGTWPNGQTAHIS
jgi:hypothetical protein